MECLELAIPPLPQCLTVGYSKWMPGMQHFERNFNVYDLLIVKSGCFYMTENDVPYALGAGDILLLEPGKTHVGHRPVEVETEVYWTHYLHASPIRKLRQDQIPWSYILTRGTDIDQLPSEQYVYVPKQMRTDLRHLLPILDEMVDLHRMFSVKNAFRLQLLSAELLHRLQLSLSAGRHERSRQLSDQIEDYLLRRHPLPFDGPLMESELHFNIDYMSRCLKRHTGLSPLQYAHRLQMQDACTLLRQTDLSLQAVAERVGQPNVNYFVRLFRQNLGISPGRYRSQYKSLI